MINYSPYPGFEPEESETTPEPDINPDYYDNDICPCCNKYISGKFVVENNERMHPECYEYELKFKNK